MSLAEQIGPQDGCPGGTGGVIVWAAIAEWIRHCVRTGRMVRKPVFELSSFRDDVVTLRDADGVVAEYGVPEDGLLLLDDPEDLEGGQPA
jgi:hypothetical protein